jgi:uncharacterized membrane protein
MELIDYTNKWLDGEIYEDLAMVVAGIVVLILSILAWRLGTSESAHAMIIPLLVVAVLFIGMGAGLAVNNKNRVQLFEQQYKESPQKFLENEKQRVEEFMKIYPQTIIVAAVMMVVGICVFAFCAAPWLRATALALILVALMALTIDYFSKERGIIYQQELNSVEI